MQSVWIVTYSRVEKSLHLPDMLTLRLRHDRAMGYRQRYSNITGEHLFSQVMNHEYGHHPTYTVSGILPQTLASQ